MTTLGPINSQNRVANYSANYRASPSLPLSSLGRVALLYTGSADYRRCRPIICHRAWSPTRSSRAVFFPPLPPHIPGILSRAFDRIRYRWNAEFAKTSIENRRTVPMHTIPRRVQELFGARPHHLYTTDRDTIENAWSAGSPIDSLTKRTGIRKAKVPLVHENRRLPSPRFSSLSLSVFSPFHFHFDKQELDDKAEAEYKNAQWNG